MTTTGRTAASKKKLIQVEWTLDELSEQFDEHLGRRADVGEAVRAYRHHSDVLAAHATGGAHRQAIRSALSRAVTRGPVQIEGRALRRYISGGGERRVIRSEGVKQSNPQLWLDSRVTTPRLSLRSPEPARIVLTTEYRTAAAAWQALECSQAVCGVSRREVNAARAVLTAAFSEARAYWDGTGMVTVDGWQIGFGEATAFSAPRCRELIVARGLRAEDYETVETTPETIRFRLEAPSGEAVDLDGE